jgi:hypothetical protein
MTLAMYWCVRVGRDEALHHPTVLEKKLKNNPIQAIGASENFIAVWCPGSNADCVT